MVFEEIECGVIISSVSLEVVMVMFEDVFSKEVNSYLRFNTSFLKVLSSRERN